MLRLRSRVGAPESIVRLRNWRMQPLRLRGWRMYMEFCPFGDLFDLADNGLYSKMTRLNALEKGLSASGRVE